MLLGLMDLAAVSLTATSTAALLWAARHAMQGRKSHHHPADPPESQITFLIEEDRLLDCTAGGAEILARRGDAGSDRDAVIASLETFFPTLGSVLDDGVTTMQTINPNRNEEVWLEITPIGKRIRVSVVGSGARAIGQLGMFHSALENAELNDLREITKNAPQLMWRTDKSGQLTWANDAYLAICDARINPEDSATKLPSGPLFMDLGNSGKIGKSTTRSSVTLSGSSLAQWFDVTSITSETGTQFIAVNADTVVRAEIDQRNFVQTLSQTFAQLSTGLAIFDRRRQLATFNPALLDMTNLQFEFLSGRPSIDALLDRLREHRILPEPKDYTSWREQFTALEKAAKDGTYSENWNLPDGQTFRVTGRPHPDGAFALLFEDISAEVSLTRRFRSEIETSQAVLDSLDDAIVVFSNSGNLVLANDAYCALWDTDLEQGITRHDLPIELRKWQSRCTPTRIWTNLREFTTQMGMRQPWTDTALLDDGRQITCIASPITGGMTMIRFYFGKPPKPSLQSLDQGDQSLISAKG